MFCENCGKQVEDNAAFCEHCGHAFEQNAAPATSAPVAEAAPAGPKAPSKLATFFAAIKNKAVAIHKKNKLILPGCGLGLVAIIVGIVLLVGFLSQIPMKDFTKIEVTGYEGFSEFVCDLDEQSIMLRALGFEECEEYDDYKYFDEDDIEKAYKGITSKDQRKALEELANSLDVEYEFPEGRDEYTLRNGDEIKIILSCDEDAAKALDFPLKESTFTYTVSGLKSVDLIDVFSYFDLKITGADGYASANMVCNKTEEVKKGDYTFTFTEGNRYFTYKNKTGGKNDIYLYVSADNNGYLTNGDELTIRTDYINNDMFLEAGFAVAPTQKETTVEGLSAPKDFDLLQYYTLEYYGISGDAYVDRAVASQEEVIVDDLRIDLVERELYIGDQYIAYYYFNYSNSSDLTNGDEITLSINYDEDDFARAGIKLTATEKVITVEGAYEYVDTLSDLDPIKDELVEIAKQDLVEELEDDWSSMVHDSYFGSYTDTTYTDPVLHKTILINDPTSYTENYLWLVFSTTVTDNEITTPTTYYFALYDSDLAYSTTREALRYDASFYCYYSGYESYEELEAEIGEYGEMEIQ